MQVLLFLLYVHFKFKRESSILEFIHFGKPGPAGVGADAILLVVDDNYGAVAFRKLVDMLRIRKLLRSIVECREFKSLAVEAHGLLAVLKLQEVCTVVVCTFLRLYHGDELARHRGAVHAVVCV